MSAGISIVQGAYALWFAGYWVAVACAVWTFVQDLWELSRHLVISSPLEKSVTYTFLSVFLVLLSLILDSPEPWSASTLFLPVVVWTLIHITDSALASGPLEVMQTLAVAVVLQLLNLYYADNGSRVLVILAGTELVLVVITFPEYISAAFGRVRTVITHIAEHEDTKHLAMFFWYWLHSLTASFMVVEALYGYWSNSLGLMSDAAHMCFDSTALAISLYASYVSKFPPDEDYPCGYSRYEVLSGLINGIFLVFVGFTVFVEGIQRLLEPPVIDGAQLIVVSFIGLGINIIGLFFFSGGDQDDDSNLRGVFLHIMADAMGSIGVIVSAFCIYTKELYISDPICSIIISILILSSVRKLLVDAIRVLMQRDVNALTPALKQALESVPGVMGIAKFHTWKLSHSEHYLTARVLISAKSDPILTTRDCLRSVQALGVPQSVIEVHVQGQ